MSRFSSAERKASDDDDDDSPPAAFGFSGPSSDISQCSSSSVQSDFITGAMMLTYVSLVNIDGEILTDLVLGQVMLFFNYDELQNLEVGQRTRACTRDISRICVDISPLRFGKVRSEPKIGLRIFGILRNPFWGVVLRPNASKWNSCNF